jgi:hypothetical protein
LVKNQIGKYVKQDPCGEADQTMPAVLKLAMTSLFGKVDQAGLRDVLSQLTRYIRP